MRVLLVLTFVMALFSGVPAAQATNNPLIRTCQIHGGTFWVLRDGDQDLALCFFGEAGIGAEALLKFKISESSEAMEAYKKHSSSFSKGGVCGAFGADVLIGKDTEGHSYNVCRFEDQSLIEETTLWFGPGAPKNEGLDKTLKRTY